MNKFAILTILAGTALSAPAMAADISAESKSTYKENEQGDVKKVHAEKSVDAAGTKRTSKTTAEVDMDDDGNYTKKTTSKSATDPKGLMNKKTAKTETKVKVKDGEATETVKKTVDGKTVVDTSSTVKTNHSSNY